VRERKAQVGIRGIVLPPFQGKRTKASTDDREQPNLIEIKLDRLIDDTRLLRSQMIAFDKRLRGIEAYLKTKRTTAREQIETMVRGSC
jgi:hypothetical protein